MHQVSCPPPLFRSFLQAGFTGLTLFATGQASLRDYALRNTERVQLLKLLLENEISRLRVWMNVTSDPIKDLPSSLRSSVESTVSHVSSLSL